MFDIKTSLSIKISSEDIKQEIWLATGILPYSNVQDFVWAANRAFAKIDPDSDIWYGTWSATYAITINEQREC